MSDVSKKDRYNEEYLASKELLPRPDPTVLTTQQLLREVSSVREILEARLNGMDKAITLLQAAVDRSPTIPQVYAEFTEKFNSINIQFIQRDVRFEQTRIDSKLAIDAALQAAKEAVEEQNRSSSVAVAKSEAATTKQMDSIVEMIQTNTKSLDDKINDLKDRLAVTASSVVENQRGIIQHAKGFSDGWGYIAGFIGIIVAIISVTLGLLKH